MRWTLVADGGRIPWQVNLAELMGGEPRASEIMNRKRPLTLRMIQKINSSWKIPASSLIAPYHLEGGQRRGGLTPFPWFLPGGLRIRGGAARDFFSVWPFHRGIHLHQRC